MPRIRKVSGFFFMVLNIKNREADLLARERARQQNKSVTILIIDALRAELEREKRVPGSSDVRTGL